MSDKPDRFTERARGVLASAHEVAERLQKDQIGTEHVLYAMTLDQFSAAGRVLRELGVEPRRVKEIIERENTERRSTAINIVISSDTKEVLRTASEHANRMGEDRVGTAHLLLALANYRKGPGFDLLEQFGISSRQVRRQTISVLHESKIISANLPRPGLRPSAIKCPKDGSDLDSKFISGARAYQCPKCRGLFVRKDTLRKLYEMISSTTPMVFSAAGFDPAEITVSALVCPDDGTEMVLRLYRNQEVDLCLECESVWLEEGALDLVWAMHEEGTGPALVPVQHDVEAPTVRGYLQIIPETARFVFESIMDIAEEILRWRSGG